MECDAIQGEVVNLGNPREHTVLEYATMIRTLCSSASPIVQAPAALGDDPHRRQPDICKAQRLLGWEPRTDLETGLQLTIDYFRQELHAPVQTAAS
jgi:nucleoside-diphosphate-sugar epimerase